MIPGQRRYGHSSTVTIGGERFTITINQRADGTLAEVFIGHGKYGSSAAGLMHGYATALTTALAYRVPLTALIEPALGLLFTPNGHTDDPEIPRARSVVDYLARRLAIDWLPYPERAALGIFTLAERIEQSRTWLTPDRLPVPA
jgi:hypothetical protein